MIPLLAYPYNYYVIINELFQVHYHVSCIFSIPKAIGRTRIIVRHPVCNVQISPGILVIILLNSSRSIFNIKCREKGVQLPSVAKLS